MAKMTTVVTKSFKIKTEDGFSDPINFLSESVFFRDGKNLDTHLENLDDKIDTEIQNRKDAVEAEQKARESADTTLDNKINKEIQDRENAVGNEKSARESADIALGGRIDKETQDREKAIGDEKSARESADADLDDKIDKETQDREDADTILDGKIETLKNTDISQINTNISTLQTTANENKTNISSLEVFIKGKNTVEENTPGLVDQVAANATKAQENYDAIEALKTLVGASSLEEGAPNLLNIINLLESRISVLEGLVLTAPDEPGGEGPVEPETPEEGEAEEPIV